MAIPILYNIRSMKCRWSSSIVAVLGIAGTVGTFVATLALAQGFKSTLVSSGSVDNAIVMRAGATSEITGAISKDDVRIIEEAPGVARDSRGPLITPEVVQVALFPLRSTGTRTNVQIRGVSSIVLQVRKKIRIIEGRFVEPGLTEVVVGKNAARNYAGLTLGDSVQFEGRTWKIVGVFDAGGSSFDSEVWCDDVTLAQTYDQPLNVYQSATVRLSSAEAFQQFKDAITADPRLTVETMRESDYYDKQSRNLTEFLTVLGALVAAIMAVGAIFGALNTMYSAVADRSCEIATMRAIGFSKVAVVFSFLLEALLIAFVGGLLGCLAVLPLNGVRAGVMNWQTFSHLAFAFRVTAWLLFSGLVFALVMGLVGGLPPAVRAAKRPVVEALRAL